MASPPFQRYFLELSYSGTSYHGWQKQPNAKSVQGEIEKAFYKVTNNSIPIVGCGRTDTGVHASYYVAHIDANGLSIKPDQLVRASNTKLDKDIHLKSIQAVDNNVHARFDAIARSYCYKIISDHDPFKINQAYYHRGLHNIDVAKLDEAAALILPSTHFESFAKIGSDVDNYDCQIIESFWKSTNEGLNYTITANRFLRGMVRLIVGMCLDVGMGNMSISHVQDCLVQGTYPSKRWSVPAEGLFLTDVRYPAEVFKRLT